MGVGQPLSLQRWAEERERERAHGGAAESRERHVLYAAAPRVSLRHSERRQRRTAPRQDTTARTVLADLREPLLDRAHRFEPSRWVCVAKLKVDRGVTCAAVRQPHLPLFLANSPERPSVRHSRHRWEYSQSGGAPSEGEKIRSIDSKRKEKEKYPFAFHMKFLTSLSCTCARGNSRRRSWQKASGKSQYRVCFSSYCTHVYASSGY